MEVFVSPPRGQEPSELQAYQNAWNAGRLAWFELPAWVQKELA